VQLEEIQKNRVIHEVLDSNPHQNIYFLIASSKKSETQLFQFGKILKRYDAFFLFKTSKVYIDKVRDVPLRMEQLDLTGIDLRNEQITQKSEITTLSNPIIEKILKEISLDTLRAYVKKLQSFNTRNSSSAENKDVVCPWLADLLRPLCDSVYLQTCSSGCGPNVIGIKKGKKNPSLTNYCLIGGHLDGVVTSGPYKAAGADDNASGTGAVLECARVFKNYSFENTVEFVLFNGEESGLTGSKKISNDMKSKGHTIIGGAVTYDMLGHSSASSKNLVQLEGFDNTTVSKKFVTEYMQGIVDKYTKMKTYQFLQGFGSDHVSFNSAGYVAILLIEREYEHPAYHKNFDTLDCPAGFNDMNLFLNITKTGTAAIAELAVPMDNSGIVDNTMNADINNPFSRIVVTPGKKGELHFSIPQPINESITIAIHSAEGKLIKTVSTRGQDLIVNLNKNKSGMSSAGLYFIRLTSNTYKQNRKIILN
jgi:hypothetical protein